LIEEILRGLASALDAAQVARIGDLVGTGARQWAATER
jgi:hypothetical protein